MLRFQYNEWFKTGITKWGIFSAKSGYFYYAIHKVLAELTNRTGFDSALETVNQALLYQVKDPDSLKNLYRRLYADVPELPPLPQQDGIPKIVQMPVDLSSYDNLLRKEVP